MFFHRGFFILFSLISFCLSGPAFGAEKQKTDPLAGFQVLKHGFFRVIFTTEGEHAVPFADKNSNGIPDSAEDILGQLKVAHHVLCDIVGFQAPLMSKRYADATYVDAYIFNRKKLNGHGGLAFQYSRPSDLPEQKTSRSLALYIASDIDPKKYATPTHEYFHLIQNATTNITNGWYFEGMAVWVSDAIRKRPPKKYRWEDVDHLLTNPEGKNKLLSVKFKGADYLWIPLSNLCPQARVSLPSDDPLLRTRYADGSPIMQDFVFSGALLMKKIMQGIAAVEHIPFANHKYKKWNTNRMNPLNDPYLFPVVMESINNMCR